MDPDVQTALDELRQRIAALEAEVARLRNAPILPQTPDFPPRHRPGPPPGTYPVMAEDTDGPQ